MRPAPFAYERAATVEEMLAALAADGGAALLAGGQSLVPRLRRREARPARLLDIDGLAELDFLALDDDGGLRIGPLRRHAALEAAAELDGPWRALPEAAARIAMRPVRVRGTIGGSLANADPAAELPLVAVALGAEVVARSAAAERRIPAGEFLSGPWRTALAADEAIVEVAFPPPPAGAISAFFEVAPRALGWALASACVRVAVADGAVVEARVASGAATPVPRRIEAAERELAGGPLDGPAIERAAGAAAAAARTWEDAERDRVELVGAVVGRALHRLAAAAAGEARR